ANRRAGPGDHRGAPGERPGIVPCDRLEAGCLRGDRPGQVCPPLRRGHPAGGRGHEPPRPRLRTGADRHQDGWLTGAGGRRDRELDRGRLRRRHGGPVRPRRRSRRRRPSRVARADESDASVGGSRLHRDLPLPTDVEAAIQLGYPSRGGTLTAAAPETLDLQRAAREHLWLHFTRMGGDGEVPIIVRGDGCYLEDSKGKRYLDALAGLFSVNIGYGYGEEIGEA